MKIFTLLLLSVLFLISCASSGTKEKSSYELHFNSNEWMLDKYKNNYNNPLNIEVTVTQRSKNHFLINMKMLGRKIKPFSGINPSMFNIFTYCVNNYVSRKNNQTAWIFGGRKEESTRRVTNRVLIIGDYESLETMKKDKSYSWHKSPVRISSIEKTCNRMLNDEYKK